MRGTVLAHHINNHDATAYKEDNVQYKDHLCGLGFPNKAFMFYHMIGGVAARGTVYRAARGSGHCDMFLDQLPGRDNIVANV